MTDLTTPDPTAPAATENVSRGLLFSLGSIVVAIVGYAILSGVIGIYGYVTGIVAIAIPLVGSWLYSKGAGAPVKAGRLPFIGIQIAAVIIGALTVVVASAWYRFSAVGGDGGLFSSAFWRTVANSAGDGDVILPVIITLAAGGFGIFAALRNKPAKPVAAPAASPFDATPDAPAPVAPAVPGAPATGSPASSAPISPPPAPPVANQPSPGVTLNGEPVDPNKP